MSLCQIIKIKGKYISLFNSFVLSGIESIFGSEVRWDNRPQPLTSLLWKSGCHCSHSETSTTHLSLNLLSSYFVCRFLGKIGISCIPRTYGNVVVMATKMKTQ